MDNDNESQGSPRYVDERGEADKNLRPNPDETEQRETDKEPLDLENKRNEEEADEDEADEEA